MTKRSCPTGDWGLNWIYHSSFVLRWSFVIRLSSFFRHLLFVIRASLVIRDWSFVILSSFVIRHWAFAIGGRRAMETPCSYSARLPCLPGRIPAPIENPG